MPRLTFTQMIMISLYVYYLLPNVLLWTFQKRIFERGEGPAYSKTFAQMSMNNIIFDPYAFLSTKNIDNQEPWHKLEWFLISWCVLMRVRVIFVQFCFNKWYSSKTWICHACLVAWTINDKNTESNISNAMAEKTCLKQENMRLYWSNYN